MREIAYHMASVRLPMDLEHFTRSQNGTTTDSSNYSFGYRARFRSGEKWVGRDSNLSLREHEKMPEHSLRRLCLVILKAARSARRSFSWLDNVGSNKQRHLAPPLRVDVAISILCPRTKPCDPLGGLLLMWLDMRYNLCCSQVVFDIWHAYDRSSRKLHNSNLWDRQRTNYCTSLASFGVFAQEEELLVLVPAWSPLSPHELRGSSSRVNSKWIGWWLTLKEIVEDLDDSKKHVQLISRQWKPHEYLYIFWVSGERMEVFPTLDVGVRSFIFSAAGYTGCPDCAKMSVIFWAIACHLPRVSAIVS